MKYYKLTPSEAQVVLTMIEKMPYCEIYDIANSLKKQSEEFADKIQNSSGEQIPEAAVLESEVVTSKSPSRRAKAVN